MPAPGWRRHDEHGVTGQWWTIISSATAVAEADQLPHEITFEPLTELLSEPMAREGHALLGATDWSQMAEARWVLNLAVMVLGTGG